MRRITTKKIQEVLKGYYPEVNLAINPAYHEKYRIRTTIKPIVEIKYADTPYPQHIEKFTCIGSGITERKAWVKAMESTIKKFNLEY